jgi:Ca-activated chloride channel family protein
MKRKFLFLLLLVLAAQARPAFADGFIIVNPPHWPQPPDHPSQFAFAPLEVSYHHVDVKIDGQIATTSVDEDFYNPNAQRLEGTYLFPIPKDAHIDKFSMEIGGHLVEAELLDAAKARSIYEDIVRRLRDPALLEYANRDVFKVRVFPIEPNGHKHIKLSYSQVLRAEAGLIGYVYPLNTEKFSAKPIKNVTVNVELKSGRPLKTIYSPTHAVEIKRDGPHRATIGYEANDVLPDSDFALYFAPEKDELGVNVMTYKPAGEDGYFLLLASPGIDGGSKHIVARDIAFVLDTSGSMMGKKIDQAKKALEFCVENLNDSDRFQIIRFSTDVEPLFDSLVDATPENRTRARDFVKDFKASGSTAIDDALQKALALRPAKSDRPFVIVFLTDGMPTIGVTDEDQIVANVRRSNASGTRIFSFGIGTDVNTHLLDKIAQETRAANQYVLPDEDLEAKVSSFYAKIKEPVLANPTLAITGGVRVSKLYPSALPDLFKGEQLIIAGRYSGEGSASVTIEGGVNGETKKFSQDVHFSGDAEASDFIPRLWATRRVGYLMDEIRLHGENGELRDEVTGLARKYGIVTPYTAYLIMEDETRRAVPMAAQSMPQISTDREVERLARDNWSAFKDDRGGEKALAGAQYGNVLKAAGSAADALSESRKQAYSALSVSPAVAAAPSLIPAQEANVRLAQYSDQGKFVSGKNFFQNDKQWIDPSIQTVKNAKHVRIKFNSDDYFALARKNPAALPWLALGRNIQFVLNDEIYEIYE